MAMHSALVPLELMPAIQHMPCSFLRISEFICLRADTGDSSSAAAKAKAARQSGEGGAAELASAPMWFSTTVEAESLPGTSRSESITDWRIVVAAPLVLDNQLPHKGSFLIWERPKVTDQRPELHPCHPG